MLLFTWNVNRKERAFRLALAHLASGAPFIAALQELPESTASTASAQTAALGLARDRVQCLGVVGRGRVGLFASPDVRQLQALASDAQTRMAMARCTTTSWPDVSVIGVHAVDRRNAATERVRGGHAVIARQGLEGGWTLGTPALVLGDLNADPYDADVASHLGLFAQRDRGEASEERPSPLVVGGRLRPFYNPMWHLLPEDNARPGGTYFFDSFAHGIRWRILDQILVSADFIPKLDGLPRILSTIAGERLLTRSGRPSQRISDHLPVELTLRD